MKRQLQRHKVYKRAMTFILSMMVSYTGYSQTIGIIKDLNDSDIGSRVTGGVDVNGVIYYAADDGLHGTELWKTDGTPSGTSMVKDINTQAPTASMQVVGIFSGSYPTHLTNVNGTLYFVANDGVNGNELWKSDGTTNGTVLVKNINSGLSSSDPEQLIVLGSTLYFTADNGSNGIELWKSDGTSSGTVMVRDIRSGSRDSDIKNITLMGSVLYFTANDGSNGSELWKTNGTSSGTSMVKNIQSGSSSSNPSSLTVVSGVLYFAAKTSAHGTELWKSNGTSSGTTLVKDIRTGTSRWGIVNSGSPNNLVNFGGTLYFAANDGSNGLELWKSNGTSSGTIMVKNIRSGSSSSKPTLMTVVNNQLYFLADNGTNGVELWKSDGTTSGTALVKDIYQGATSSGITELVVLNGTLYLNATNASNGTELWKTDGTSSGTVLVKDVYQGADSSKPQNLFVSGSKLYFIASNAPDRSELWYTDGSTLGTKMVPSPNKNTKSSVPTQITEVSNGFFFVAYNENTGEELWKSDGTYAGTYLVKDINVGSASSEINNLTAVGNIVYFFVDDGVNGEELWKSDGTSSGTVLVKDIISGYVGSSPDYLTEMNGKVYFAANNSTDGQELWESDGTSSGTRMLKDIYPGSSVRFGRTSPNYGNPTDITEMGGKIYFAASTSSGKELWVSDGTHSGTYMIRDIKSGSSSSSPQDLIKVGSTVFFQAQTASSGTELWKTDGTYSGTVLVRNILNGVATNEFFYMTESNGKLFFVVRAGTSGHELWVSNGTNSGTYMVKDIWSGSHGSEPESLTDVNGTLFFSADDNINGRELWKSDGTLSGTVMVKDIYTGSTTISTPYGSITSVNEGISWNGSFGSSFASVDGKLYFNGKDGTNGLELWESDGTAAGTKLVRDIRPGISSSYTTGLTSVGNKLYFVADDGTNGKELMGMRVCVTTNPLPTERGITFSSSYMNTDTAGWSHYCADGGELLLSLNIGSSGAVVDADEVELKLGTNTTYGYLGADGGMVSTGDNGYQMIDRRWNVNPTTQPSIGNVGVTYYFTNNEYNDVKDSSLLHGPGQNGAYKSTVSNVKEISLFKSTTGVAFADPHTVSGIVIQNDSVASTLKWRYELHGTTDHSAKFEVSSFSGGGGGVGGGGGAGTSPLPVELIHFTAKAIDNHTADLTWATATELNNSHFEVLRSYDGRSFEAIDVVSGNGTINRVVEYSYVDASLDRNENIVYYRLRQVDYDGASELTEVRRVNFLSKYSFTDNISVYPNPAREMLYISLTDMDSKIVSGELLDINGKMVQAFDLSSTLNTIDISSLIPGVYFVRLRTNNNVKHVKITKQ